jgi:hypothetical protein
VHRQEGLLGGTLDSGLREMFQPPRSEGHCATEPGPRPHSKAILEGVNVFDSIVAFDLALVCEAKALAGPLEQDHVLAVAKLGRDASASLPTDQRERFGRFGRGGRRRLGRE